MKDFTAIQEIGSKYSFKARDLQHAIERAPKLLNYKVIEVYEINDLGERI